MKIMNFIDKYVAMSVIMLEIRGRIKQAEDGEFYAKTEGSMAYDRHNYSLEELYNNSFNFHHMNKEKATSELSRISRHLEIAHKSYLQELESLDTEQLTNVLTLISLKINEMKSRIQELSKKREGAIAKGDAAYSSHNFNEEENYNIIATNAYSEIEHTSSILYCYEYVLVELKIEISKRNEYNSKSSNKSL